MKNQPAKQKRGPGLSTNGLARHILASIFVWKEDMRWKNDFKQAVSTLVRAYHTTSLSKKTESLIHYTPAAIEQFNEKHMMPALEHVIPVNCVVEGLFHLFDEGMKRGDPEALPKLIAYLDKTTLLARVATIETKNFKESKLESRMLTDSFDIPWNDLFVRYRKSGLGAKMLLVPWKWNPRNTSTIDTSKLEAVKVF